MGESHFRRFLEFNAGVGDIVKPLVRVLPQASMHQRPQVTRRLSGKGLPIRFQVQDSCDIFADRHPEILQFGPFENHRGIHVDDRIARRIGPVFAGASIGDGGDVRIYFLIGRLVR